ncbi:XIAP-associated factor 1 [Lemmus lemmus]
MEADFQVCQNCKRNVASVHFTLHEAHCLRFLVVCPECEEPIPQSKMKEHADTVHQQKQCPASRTVTYLQDGKPKILPPSLTSQVTGNQTSSVKKDVRPKTRNRKSATKQETKDQNGTVDLPLKSALQQRAALPTGDESAYDILRRCCQCGILLPLPILNQHQVPCSPLNPAATSPGWEPTLQYLTQPGERAMGDAEGWRGGVSVWWPYSSSHASSCFCVPRHILSSTCYLVCVTSQSLGHL